ncbi:hypothetical protein B0H63DRAFT_522028 [Podospora didyma]|uniref:Uncharacterized protein n=1 Tax=Podospora didyma TaxID=330526 RepID=A0AAE0NUT7_9PEZI|nr:hypothetical protein B0H63DRAFT_522028 [Podospora didyma]
MDTILLSTRLLPAAHWGAISPGYQPRASLLLFLMPGIPRRSITSSPPARQYPEFAEVLRRTSQTKWGWVIYRTAYGDEKAWARFKHIVTARWDAMLASSRHVPREVVAAADLVVSDYKTLSGASRTKLRRRHHAWAAEAEMAEMEDADEHSYYQTYEEHLDPYFENPGDKGQPRGWIVGWVKMIHDIDLYWSLGEDPAFWGYWDLIYARPPRWVCV